MAFSTPEIVEVVIVIGVVFAGQCSWIYSNWRTPSWSWLQAVWPFAAIAAYLWFSIPIYARSWPPLTEFLSRL